MAVSYFSNALQIVFDRMDVSRSAFCDRVGIAASTLHGLYHGHSRPSVEDLEKICSALIDLERVELVTAHLRDETPASAADLIRIVSLLDTTLIREEPADESREQIKLPKEVENDFDYLRRMAMKHPAVVDSIRSTARLMRMT